MGAAAARLLSSVVWFAVLLGTLLLVQWTNGSDRRWREATAVDLRRRQAALTMGKEDLKQVTHKVYFDVEIDGKPAGTFFDDIVDHLKLMFKHGLDPGEIIVKFNIHSVP